MGAGLGDAIDFKTFGYGMLVGIVLFIIVFFALIVPAWRGGRGVWSVLDYPMKWLGVYKREGYCNGPMHPNAQEELNALNHSHGIVA